MNSFCFSFILHKTYEETFLDKTVIKKWTNKQITDE